MLYSMDDLFNILPIIIVVGWACVLILVDVFLPKKFKDVTIWLTVLGLAIASRLMRPDFSREMASSPVVPLGLQKASCPSA